VGTPTATVGRRTAGRLTLLTLLAAAGFVAALGARLPARDQFPDTFFSAPSPPAVDYATKDADDPVARLNKALRNGEAQLVFDAGGAGYLRAVLAALNVPIESQIAVFAKRSLQAGIISPNNPRSIFFSDSVAVAWPRGGFIETVASDPNLGPVFYALQQQMTTTPQFVRTQGCLQCHQSNETLGVPGMLLRSQATAADGRSLPQLGNFVSDHRSPFEERWGGWFVTGHASAVRHLGNRVADEAAGTDIAPGTAILDSLSEKLDTASYLSPYSDVGALMVFDHQMHMSNLLTRIAWEARVPSAWMGSSDVSARVRDVALELVDYMLFVDEAKLPAAIEGSSGFAQRFSSDGPRDSRGRSLRQLDLEHRLLRYPCSYMIYTEAFDRLPAEAKDAIYRRMWDVLSGRERGARYDRLMRADREAIVEILIETKKDLPGYFSATL
jgi:hypothetical protein